MDDAQRCLAQQQAEICNLFGNPNRVLILWTISTEEQSVGDIATAIGASLQNTSQHLRLMRNKGVLTARREGNTIYYRLQRQALPAECPLLEPMLSSKEKV